MKLRLSWFGAFVWVFHKETTINHAQLPRPWVNYSLLNTEDFTPGGVEMQRRLLTIRA